MVSGNKRKDRDIDMELTRVIYLVLGVFLGYCLMSGLIAMFRKEMQLLTKYNFLLIVTIVARHLLEVQYF